MKNMRRGLTMVEVVIASAVMLFIISAIYALVYRGSDTYSTVSKQNTLQRNAQIVLDRIAEDLRNANPDTLIVGANSLSLQVASGYAAGSTTWGPTITYSVETSVVDANNNGVTSDDGCIMRRIPGLSPPEAVRICDYVPLVGGFTTARTGSVVTVTLTLGAKDQANKDIKTTVGTSVVLRNKSQI